MKNLGPQTTQSNLLTFDIDSPDEIKHKISIFNNNKASREGDISVNILKDTIDTYLIILTSY